MTYKDLSPRNLVEPWMQLFFLGLLSISATFGVFFAVATPDAGPFWIGVGLGLLIMGFAISLYFLELAKDLAEANQ
jgi:hypothetical protein